MSSPIFHIDYETRSTIPLDERGFHNYITHPTTEVILCAYAEGDHKVKLWEPHLSPMPLELRDALSDPWLVKAAWNSTFERGITQYVLEIGVSVDEWVDPMCSARYMSLPGSLGDVSQILGLKEDTGKIKDGKRLIGLFCEPAVQESSGLFGDTPAGFRDWSTNPEDWHLFGEYCRRDVEAERAIHKKLRRFPIPESELRVWKMDQKVNAAGIPVDQTLVKGAQHIADIELAQLRVKLKAITGLENTNSNEQFLAWVTTQGFTFGSIGKAFVARALSGECDLTDAAKEALEIRKMTSKSSVNKFKVIADNMNEDGRLRHQFVYYGAARTGRFCLAEDTLIRVQTESGVVLNKPIQLVQKMDRVWDGENWVVHEGVVFSGNKEVIEWDGICATESHVVWTSSIEKMSLSEARSKQIPLWKGFEPCS